MKANLQISIETLLQAKAMEREIARATGVDRKTIRRNAPEANSPGWPPAPTAVATTSACEVHCDSIESQRQLGRNAMSIYQDLVERFGFTHRYNS